MIPNALKTGTLALLIGGSAWWAISVSTATPSVSPTAGILTPTSVNRAGPDTAYPDPRRTPGVPNPAVNQGNIMSTICVSGWTATIRPPASYTNALKATQMADLRLIGTAQDYEEDHFIPLELGGHPTDARNLWPQPWGGDYGAHKKDLVENELHRKVCSGGMQLEEAQNIIRTDWVAELKRMGK